jgi:NADPH2:quinone reductase
MQAIQVHNFGGPEVLQLESVATPQLQSDQQVLVKIEAIGVNPVDTYIRAGTYARRPALPYIPGIDAAGVVAAVGNGVDRFTEGDRVYGGWPLTGTYAEYALYDSQWVYPLPQEVSFTAGAGVFLPYSTAYRALFHKGKAQSGDTVLIHGATGAVGLAATQLAVAAGLLVIGTGGSEAGRSLVKQQGAQAVFDHTQEGYANDILTITDGRGVDVVLEMLANVNLNRDLEFMAPEGRVVIIGSRGEVTITPRQIMSRETIITGLTLFNTPSRDMHRIQRALFAGLHNGTLQPIVYQVLRLGDAAQAHADIMTSTAQGNYVLVP